MRILIISQYFWPESFRINDLALGLMERGNEIMVLTGVPNYPSGRFFPGYNFLSPAKEVYMGIRVARVPVLPRGKGQGWRLLLNYLSFVISACLLGPLRCRGEFDAIFVFQPSPVTVGLPAVLFRWLKKVPMLFWVQDLWPESLSATGAVRSRQILSWVRRLVRFIYRRSDRILIQSRRFESHVIGVGAAAERVLYLPNWAEAMYRFVMVEPEAQERSELPHGFRIVFAGNIGAAQSFETILAAAQQLKDYTDIHWVILGDGHRRSWLEQQLIVLGLQEHVHLLGQRPIEAMPRYFALGDALLVTLRNDPIFSLTIPSKIQSYLACGKPIVAALDGEGARVIRESGAGIVAAAEDAQALAQAVLNLYRMSPAERCRMGKHGEAYFKANFDRAMLIDKLENWIVDVKKERACVS